jgi:hypothetical protein
MKTRVQNLTGNVSTIAVSLLLMLVCWAPTPAIEYVEQASTQDRIPAWVWDKPVWEPCEYEDSRNCVWNAKRRGNGVGDSVIVTSKGRVIVIKHWQAYRLVHPNYAP